MTEKKLVDRKIAIALGITTIILLVGLVGALDILENKDTKIRILDSEIQDLTNEKNQLQTWLEGNESLLNQTQTWLEGNISSLSSQIAILQSQITSYETEITSLNAQINQLQTWLNENVTYYASQINSLQNQISQLEDEIEHLRAVDLDGYAGISGLIYITVTGYVWNYGTETAHGVSVTVCLTYRATIVYSATKYIGDVQGRNVAPFDLSFTYTGLWDNWYWYIE